MSDLQCMKVIILFLSCRTLITFLLHLVLINKSSDHDMFALFFHTVQVNATSSGHLREVDWFDVFLGKSANEMWNYFKEVVTTLMDAYIPLKSAKFRKKKGHWLKATTVKMIKKRDAAWRKYIQFKSTAKFDRYKSIRNTVNSMVRADGVAYRKSLLQGFKGNPKKFYGYMRNLCTVKDVATTLRRSDGTTTASDQETAE